MNRHATLDELARLGADDLRSRKAARVSNHLAACTECAELNDQISSVPALLSSVQFPEMPATLAVMIDSTLAAEAARRVAAEPATESARRDLPVRSGRSRVRRGPDRPRIDRAAWRPVPATRVLATAAAIIVVGIGAYAIASHTAVSSSGPSGSPAAVASPPLASQVSLGPSVTYRQDDASKSIQTVTANADVKPATLAGQVETALTEAKMEGMRASPAKTGIHGSSLAAPTSTSAVNGSSTLGSPGAASASSLLSGCIARVIPRGQALLMVERAKFEGKPATIIVTAPASLSGTSPPKQAEIWAVGSACSATSTDLLDHVKVARL
ncbi:MAG TPA: hypothetical protein VMA73_34430 [Streptosporangiaceae bacterium]|nr:hypothetical protein [Streptosporangiaceae bacterium]